MLINHHFLHYLQERICVLDLHGGLLQVRLSMRGMLRISKLLPNMQGQRRVHKMPGRVLLGLLNKEVCEVPIGRLHRMQHLSHLHEMFQERLLLGYWHQYLQTMRRYPVELCEMF